MRVKDGSVILLDYLVRLGTGKVVETSKGKCPIEYLHGNGQILPGLERALEGLHEGEQASFSISPEDAYGARKEDNIVSLPKTLFPARSLPSGRGDSASEASTVAKWSELACRRVTFVRVRSPL